MKIIACVDNKFGLMFNKRRQSQDRIVREKIKELNETIYMNEYSYKLYQDVLDNVVVDEMFLEKAENHYCLIENVSVKDYLDKIDEVVLFRWNRDYPRDFCLDIDLSSYEMIEQVEFQGSSHTITMEVYKR